MTLTFQSEPACHISTLTFNTHTHTPARLFYLDYTKVIDKNTA